MPESPQPGRPTKKTPETLARLEEALRLGLSHRQASAYGRIDYSTFKAWKDEDPDFSAQVNAWESEGIVHHARQLYDAGEKGGPQVAASKFFLATRRRDGWTEKQAVEHSGSLSFTQAVADLESRIEREDED